MSARTVAVSGALLLAVAAPATASAATLEPLKPCYVTAGTAAEPQGEEVVISAAGFTPNSKVDLAIDGQPAPGGAGLQVSPSGTLPLPPGSVQAPFIARGTRKFTVTLTEQGNPANTVTGTARTTALGVRARPRQVSPPSERVRWKGRGFTADRPVYAHYIYTGRGGQKKDLRKTVRMARKTGSCGTWSARRPQIPVDDPDAGRWLVQFDQSKRYRDPASGQLNSVFVQRPITVTFSRR